MDTGADVKFRVTLIDTEHRDRFGGGWPSFTIPIQGGIVRDGGLTVEVAPVPEGFARRDRSYDEIKRLATRAENQGGYVRVGGPDGEEAHVGEDILVGRDFIEFLTEGLNRSRQREHPKGHYNQGYNDALDDLRKAVRGALNSVHERYDD